MERVDSVIQVDNCGVGLRNKGKGKRKDYTESSKDQREDLRGEIRKLRKEVLQLRKENAKLRGRDFELQEILEEVTIDEPIVKKRCCPTCKTSQINIVEKLRDNKDYFFCQNSECNARGPLE